MADKLPFRIRAEEVSGLLSAWSLPEVGSSHVVGIERKQPPPAPEPDPVTVVDDELLPQAEQQQAISLQEIEQIREEAYEEGFSRGRDDGYQHGQQKGEQQGFQQGLEKAQAEVDAKLAQLQALIDVLQNPLEQERQAVCEQLTDVAIKVASTVVDAELASDPRHIASAVSKAVALVPKQTKDVTIHLNPADVSHIQPLLTGSRRNWELLADESVIRGGCMVEAGNSTIDYRTDMRFAEILTELGRELSHSAELVEDDANPVDRAREELAASVDHDLQSAFNPGIDGQTL